MIMVKSPDEIDTMRRCGRILVAVLNKLRIEVKPRITTRELDSIAIREMEARGGEPSFKNYQGFPANICVSVNNEIVHGIPGERVLKEGDIVSLDAGVKLNGFHTDAAITVGVGEISQKAKELISATEGTRGLWMSYIPGPISLGYWNRTKAFSSSMSERDASMEMTSASRAAIASMMSLNSE